MPRLLKQLCGVSGRHKAAACVVAERVKMPVNIMTHGNAVASVSLSVMRCHRGEGNGADGIYITSTLLGCKYVFFRYERNQSVLYLLSTTYNSDLLHVTLCQHTARYVDKIERPVTVLCSACS